MLTLLPPRNVGYSILAILGIVVFCLILLLPKDGEFKAANYWENEPVPPPVISVKTFEGDSTGLTQTTIVPTLDTPIPDGKSAIWCSSLVLAWKQLQSDIVKEPILVERAEAVADRLNRARETQDDLAPGTAYAAAGLVRDGILKKIQKDMRRLFPEVELLPPVHDENNLIVAYAYLQANVKFVHTYIENDKPFVFTDLAGKKTTVQSFGIRPEDKHVDANMVSFRGQLRILWQRPQGEFAIDLCAESTPNQIVLAKMSRKSTLEETFTELEANTGGLDASKGSQIGDEDSLLVPNQFLSLQHHFHELEGGDKKLLNASLSGLHIGTALQAIQFKLNRAGAEVASHAGVGILDGGPQAYHFDKPFLIVMKKRAAKRPFFVMWVDNAELLAKM